MSPSLFVSSRHGFRGILQNAIFINARPVALHSSSTHLKQSEVIASSSGSARTKTAPQKLTLERSCGEIYALSRAARTTPATASWDWMEAHAPRLHPGRPHWVSSADHFRDLSQAIASIRAPYKPEEQRAALANSFYHFIRTRMTAAFLRGIAVQILTFGLERRRRVPLTEARTSSTGVLAGSASPPQPAPLLTYCPSSHSVAPNRGVTAL